ncbi:MAG: hypothetical protein JXA66_03895 [Oligoflexia bacterium]|nr:hypothetical protein [Oligoflexia bacterium]
MINYILVSGFITAVIVSNVQVLTALFCLALLVFILRRIRISVFLKRAAFVAPFLLFLLIFQREHFCVISLRVLTAVICVAVITNNFNITGLSMILKRIRLPEYLRDIFLLSFRFSFDFVDDIKSIKKALLIRGAANRKTVLKASYLGTVIGLFFVRAVTKSEDVYKSMKLKGY